VASVGLSPNSEVVLVGAGDDWFAYSGFHCKNSLARERKPKDLEDKIRLFCMNKVNVMEKILQ
jgi:hypothetical protein